MGIVFIGEKHSLQTWWWLDDSVVLNDSKYIYTCEKATQGRERVTAAVMHLWHKPYLKTLAQGSTVE